MSGVPEMPGGREYLWFIEGALVMMKADIEGETSREEVAQRVQRLIDLVHQWGHSDAVPDVQPAEKNS